MKNTFSPLHIVILVLLTLVWGLNWPVMKLGVATWPPLTFRAMSMWLGLPVLALGLWVLKVPFGVPRHHWRELVVLAATNMFVWHVFVILGVKALSSGRAAILGYTMPIFSAIWGLLFFGASMRARHWLGVGAAGLGVMLLLWHELSALTGAPLGALFVLLAAGVWGLGVQMLRATSMPVPILTIVWWMTVMTAVLVSVLAAVFESQHWPLLRASLATPAGSTALWATLYNAVLVFGFATAAWNWLARTLPPLASTLSVMLIPVLGVFSGALWLGEVLHWQDWAAVALMVVAIASVVWPGGSRVPDENRKI